MDTKHSAGAEVAEASVGPRGDRRPLMVGLDPELQAWYRAGRHASAVNGMVKHWLDGDQEALPRVRVPRDFVSRNIQVRLKPETVERLRVVCREKSIPPSAVVRGLIALRAVGRRRVLDAIASWSDGALKDPVVALCLVLRDHGVKADLDARRGNLSLAVLTRILLEGWVRAGSPPVRFIPDGDSKLKKTYAAGVKFPSEFIEEVRRVAEARGQTFTAVARALVHSFAEAGKPKSSVVDLMAEALRTSAKEWVGPEKAAYDVFDGMTFDAARTVGTEKLTAKEYQERLRKWGGRPRKLSWGRGAVFADDSISVPVDVRTLDRLLEHLRDASTNSRTVGELMTAIARDV